MKKLILIGMCISLLLMVGCVSKVSLEDAIAWSECRDDAWDSCMMTEFVHLSNYIFESSCSESDAYKVMSKFDIAVHECWDTKADICDSNVDMDQVYKVLAEVQG